MDNNPPGQTESIPEDNEATGINIGEKTTIIVIVGVIISPLIGVSLYSVGTTVTIPDTITIFNLIDIFGPLLFSLLIALIYWQLYDVQKSEADIPSQQKEIQSRQRRIEAQQNRPALVNRWMASVPTVRTRKKKAFLLRPTRKSTLTRCRTCLIGHRGKGQQQTLLADSPRI